MSYIPNMDFFTCIIEQQSNFPLAVRTHQFSQHSNSFLCDSNNILDCSSYMITWWPMVKLLLEGPVEGQKLFFKRRVIFHKWWHGLVHIPKGLHCDSPVRSYQRPQTASLSAIEAPSTIESAVHMAQVAVQLAQQPGLVSEPSILHSIQN